MVTWSEKWKMVVKLAHSFCAIGSGALIATVILNCRDYHERENFSPAIYMVYEAKRFSEKADGVGPKTKFIWTAPLIDEEPTRKGIGFVSDFGLAYLEAMFQRTGLKASFVMDEPPFDFREDPPSLPAPTNDPSGPQPSQESHEESDES